MTSRVPSSESGRQCAARVSPTTRGHSVNTDASGWAPTPLRLARDDRGCHRRDAARDGRSRQHSPTDVHDQIGVRVGRQAACRREQHLAGRDVREQRGRRVGSSSENTSSSNSTGGAPISVATTSCAASRSARASDRCSPCDACVRAGAPLDRQVELVAMRTDRRHRSADVVVACRCGEPPPGRLPTTARRSRRCRRSPLRRARTRSPGRAARRASRSTRAETSASPALRTARPTRRACQRALTAAVPAGHLLQERVPLPEDASRSVRSTSSFGLRGDERVVEVAAPLGGPALHQREVVGREHGDPQRTEQVTRARSRLAVHLHPLTARDRARPRSAARVLPFGFRRARRRVVAPMRTKRLGRRAAERCQRREVRRPPRAGWSCPARCRRRRR